MKNWIESARNERSRLENSLTEVHLVKRVYPSDANFLLVQVDDANSIYQYLIEKKIVVRNRNNIELCEGCLRITVGTYEENTAVLDALKQFSRGVI